MGLKIVGYITSDSLRTGFIPHQMQNGSIRQFVEEEQHQFLLSWTEYIGKAPLVLKSLEQESFFQGICFYSLEQLDHIENAREILKHFLKKNLWIGFAREKIYFQNEAQLENVIQLLWLKNHFEGSRKDLEPLWAN